MNSIIEAQIEYFDQIHSIDVMCLNDWREDAFALDFKLHNKKHCGMNRTPGVSISVRTYKKRKYETNIHYLH